MTERERKPVVLIAPPIWAVKTPPLTITTIGAAAAAAGYPVQLIDLNIELYHELASKDPKLIELWHLSNLSKWYEPDQYRENLEALLGPYMRRCAERSLASNPTVIGITLNGREPALHLAREIRKLDNKVWLVAGGQYSEPLIWGETFALSGLFQYVVRGEGELTFVELLERRRQGLPVAPLPGTIIKVRGGPVCTEGRALIEDLDALPFPLYDGLDLDRYVLEYEGPPFRKSQSFSVLSSRGCTNRCDFCIQHVIWRDCYRYRGSDNVLDEIEQLVQRHGAREINFNDLLINPSAKRLEALCRAFIERDLPVHWNGDMTINDRLDDRIAGLMKQAKCRNATFGIESASRPVLHKMGKRYSLSSIEGVLERVNRAGVKTWCSLIVGHPAEGDEDFLKTMEFLCRNRYSIAGPPGLSMCTMFRGSRLWHEREKYGIEMPRDDAAGWFRRDGTNDAKVRTRRARLLRDLARSLYSAEVWLANRDAVVHKGRPGRWWSKASPQMLLAEAAAAPDPQTAAAALRALARRLRDGKHDSFRLSRYRALLAHALRDLAALPGLQPWVLAGLGPGLPATGRARDGVVRALIGAGRLDDAKALLAACRGRKDAERAALYLVLAAARERGRNLDRLKRALRGTGRTLSRARTAERPPAAGELLEMAEQLAGEHAPAARRLLGLLGEPAGMSAEQCGRAARLGLRLSVTAAEARRSVALAPADSDLLEDLCRALFERHGKGDDAVVLAGARAVLRREPDHPYAGWLVAAALHGQGKLAAAQKAAERCLDSGPHGLVAAAHDTLAAVLLTLGDAQSARAHALAALALEPDKAQTRATLEAASRALSG